MSVTKRSELTTEERPVGGGEVDVVFHHYVSLDKLHGHGRLFAEVTIPVGGEAGVHQHVGESEYYVIHSGRGRYTMDEESWDVGPGDVTEVAPGHTHGIVNTGDEPLVFTALIVND